MAIGGAGMRATAPEPATFTMVGRDENRMRGCPGADTADVVMSFKPALSRSGAILHRPSRRSPPTVGYARCLHTRSCESTLYQTARVSLVNDRPGALGWKGMYRQRMVQSARRFA